VGQRHWRGALEGCWEVRAGSAGWLEGQARWLSPLLRALACCGWASPHLRGALATGFFLGRGAEAAAAAGDAAPLPLRSCSTALAAPAPLPALGSEGRYAGMFAPMCSRCRRCRRAAATAASSRGSASLSCRTNARTSRRRDSRARTDCSISSRSSL
jgi:hypothetical protein